MKNICLVFLLLVFIAFTNIGGCGGGGSSDDCDIDILSLTNGTSAEDTDSFYACTSDVGPFDFAIYDNGDGFSTDIGAFSWEQTGCDSIEIQSSAGDAEIVNIDVVANILIFMQESDIEELDDIGANCELVLL